MKQWEYKGESYNVVLSEVIKILNKKGKEGWELIYFKIENAEDLNDWYTMIIKREIKQ